MSGPKRGQDRPKKEASQDKKGSQEWIKKEDRIGPKGGTGQDQKRGQRHAPKGGLDRPKKNDMT